jgi:Domain of unknown function (DUF4157)
LSYSGSDDLEVVMSFQLKPHTKTASSLAPRPGGLLQRKCACGGTPGPGGECEACRKKREGTLQRAAINSPPVGEAPPIVHDVLRSSGQPLDAGTRAFMEPRFGHDFTSVPVHPRESARGRQLSISGKPAIGSLDELAEIFIGGDRTPTPAPAPRVPIPNPPPPPTPPKHDVPKKDATACPTDIKVATVGTLKMDASFAEAGWLTGWGGFAAMEVSDSGGKTWDGTAIHENLKNVKNTCGEKGACSNANGEGGAVGSTFKVGEESDLLGIAKLPATKNTFYDLHIMGMKGVSLLHKAGKPSCEIQCEQFYDCSGKRFGPTFLVTYLLTRDTIKSAKKSYDVTQIELKKETKK